MNILIDPTKEILKKYKKAKRIKVKQGKKERTELATLKIGKSELAKFVIENYKKGQVKE